MAQILVIGVAFSLFTAMFLVTKRQKNLHDDILAAWLVAMAVPILLGFAMRNFPELRIPVLPHLIYPLTFGPFLWLYAQALTGQVRRLERRHMVHFLPFVIASLLKNLTGWPLERPTPLMETFSLEIRIAGAVNLAVLGIYSIAVFRHLRLHGSEVPEHFSELSSRVTLIWLRWIAAGITGAYLLLFIGCVAPFPPLLVVHIVALIAVILGLCFFGLRQTQLYDPRDGLADCAEENTQEVPADRCGRAFDEDPAIRTAPREATRSDALPSYSRSGLSEERADAISQRLDVFMQAEKPYLDAGLTIEALARQIAVPRHYLTQVISERYGKNFFLFVNEYRIEAVKDALRSPEHADRTLLEIAYDAGFSSKSTFNAAFKQVTGMTPSQFRASAV